MPIAIGILEHLGPVQAGKGEPKIQDKLSWIVANGLDPKSTIRDAFNLLWTSMSNTYMHDGQSSYMRYLCTEDVPEGAIDPTEHLKLLYGLAGSLFSRVTEHEV